MQNNNDHEVLYAGFLVRLWAYIIDCIIVGCAMLIIRIPKFFISLIYPDLFIFKHILFKFSIVDIVIYLCTVTYFIVMTYYYGATFGKKALNIKVLKENEEKLPIIDIIYRETIGRYLSGIILCIGYLFIALDPRKRGLHDMLCDTIVVYNLDINKKSQKPVYSESVKEKEDSNISTALIEEENSANQENNENI